MNTFGTVVIMVFGSYALIYSKIKLRRIFRRNIGLRESFERSLLANQNK